MADTDRVPVVYGGLDPGHLTRRRGLGKICDHAFSHSRSAEDGTRRRENVTMATTTLAEMVVSVALEEARRGVFERANDNRGDRVDEYEKLAGMQGEAWCAMFVF
jgi:hypothetical protein